LKAIRSLHLFTQSRKIFVITSRQNFTFFENMLEARFPIHLLDEDKIMENISLRVIQEYFARRIRTPQRAGWYFQQFLKMSICNLPDMADHYLIWDGDTVLLQPLTFFDQDGRVLVNPKTEYHKPYFELTKKVLGIDKQADFSFISEHLMINKSFMNELVCNFITRTPGGMSWVELILNSIDDQHLGTVGFSEFETYGNFVTLKYKDSFKCRSLKSTRYGAKYYGKYPNKYDIFSLMLAGYAFATFEAWQRVSKKRIAVIKTISKIRYTFCSFLRHLTNRYSERLNAAAELCR